METILSGLATFGGWIIGIVSLIVLLRTMLFTVDQQTTRVVTCFGKFVRVAQAGLNFKIPLIESVSHPISLRVKQLTLSELTYTDKGTSVTIEANVQYRIGEDDSSVQQAFYKLTNPEPQIQSHVSSAIRGKVPNMTLEQVQAEQASIANHVKAELTDTMQQYGYIIEDVLVTKADPNKTVVDANNQKYASEMAKVTAANDAAANATRVIESAKADAAAMKLHGEGIAAERAAIANGFQQSVDALTATGKGATAADAMALLAYQQYLETMTKLAQSGQSKIIFVQSGPDAATSVMDQLRNTFVGGAEAAKSDNGN